ncbi:autotransporter outer membrane beta-barrel domain-containing protein [Burkholderia sp. FERM BP-3421]|uniref:autotransporter outer membrane beta-barrel domain-containing protein n=1 Tax=Burkholderia sp. FERM BP-3421 TaxID=1494466 RepID=UPI0023618126|nr:autotransporter outer membrane beta-barrel domain-containing protein [Burkholderia sp. FERM BP-3421]WDD91466.1 autotransporter outer membrane beta-barrel domain-containing protein [Burkholderia sp. FERM BP-3421]
MTLRPTRLSLAVLTALLPSLPTTAAAHAHPGINLSTPQGESMVLNPGDTVITQDATAITISGSENSLSGDGVVIQSGIAGGQAAPASIAVDSAGTLTLSNSAIQALGARDATGVAVRHTGSQAILSGNTITTDGLHSYAVHVRDGARADITGGSIHTQGSDSHGLIAQGNGATIFGRDVKITALGVNAAAVSAQDGGHVVLDQARLNANSTEEQRGNTGIGIYRGSVTATNTAISSLRGMGVDAYGGTLSLAQSSINAYSFGILLSSASGPTLMPSQAILTDVIIRSETGNGIIAQGSGVQVSLKRVQITSNGTYVSGFWLPSRGAATLKDSTIEMTGPNGVGIDTRDGTVIMDGGKITTYGRSGHGLYASELYSGSGGRANISARGVAIETFGDSAIGVVSRTAVSNVALDGGSVVTHGNTAYGMLANGARLTATGTKVRTHGDFSTALMMGNPGVSVALDGVALRTFGQGADGVNAYARKSGVDNEITLLDSHIETEDGSGIAVSGSGLKADLIGTTIIGKSRAAGIDGAALHVYEWIDDSDPNAPAIAARHVELNAQRSRLVGDVVIDSGSASVSLRDSSTLTGALLDRGGRTVDKLNIDDGSLWQMRANSAVKDLETTGTISFSTPNTGFKVLDVSGTLSGSGLFEMRTDLVAGHSDQLRVGTVEGSHRVLIAHSGAEPLAEHGVVTLIQTEGGSGLFSLANHGQVVDVGTYRYELKTNDTVGGRASDWSLVNTARLLPPDPPPVAPPPVSPPPVDPEAEIPPATLPPAPPPVILPGPIRPRPEHLSTTANAAINTSAVGTAQAIWYAESAALTRRMGELRQGNGRDGLWVRGFGERQKLDNKGGRDFAQNLGGLQLGADKMLTVNGGRWYVGALAGYSYSDRTFPGEGRGSADSYHLGGYATWLADTGWYVDGVLKANHLRQDFKVETTDGRSVKGKTSQNAIGATLEIGRQLQLGAGWFIEPQARMALNHVSGDSYRTSNGLDVSAGSGASLQFRAGSLLGRRFVLGNGNVVQPYVKLARSHEFDGKSTVRTNGIATRTDLSGGRTELGLGVSASMGDSHRLYVDYEYVDGAKLGKPWSVSAGYRYIF